MIYVIIAFLLWFATILITCFFLTRRKTFKPITKVCFSLVRPQNNFGKILLVIKDEYKNIESCPICEVDNENEVNFTWRLKLAKAKLIRRIELLTNSKVLVVQSEKDLTDENYTIKKEKPVLMSKLRFIRNEKK
jgi:hypothetical protein